MKNLWQHAVEATSQRLAAMTVQRIEMERTKTEEEISRIKNEVPELIITTLEENRKIIKDRLKIMKTRKHCSRGCS